MWIWILIAIIYGAGILLARKLILDSNIPDEPDNPSNLSPAWAFIWPWMVIKTYPIFRELGREEKIENLNREKSKGKKGESKWAKK